MFGIDVSGSGNIIAKNIYIGKGNNTTYIISEETRPSCKPSEGGII